MPKTVQNSGMGRQKSDKPKDALVSTRTFSEVFDAISGYARKEHRTIAQMADLLLREAIISRRKAAKEPTKDIEDLP